MEQAIDWLGRQDVVEGERIGLLGASRGREPAILASTLIPKVRAVVGYTTCGVVWRGIGEGDASAWTWRGQAFPWLRFMETEEQGERFEEAKRTGQPYFDAPSFDHSLQMQSDRVSEATIPAERSQAAFLLIGNPGDGVRPSRDLSQITVDRLQAHGHAGPFRFLAYEDGGHMLIPYPFYPTTMRQFYHPTVGVWEGLGSTAEGAARAAEDSWPQVLEFIHTELGD